MQLAEIRKELKDISFIMVREETRDYFEAVILKSELAKLTPKLEKFLGQRIWPSNNKLSDVIEISIREFGGVMAGQELYFYQRDNETVFAMLWPWSNGTHVTLKIGNK